MSSILQSTRNTRALPTGEIRYIRSDVPEKNNSFPLITNSPRSKNSCLNSSACSFNSSVGLTANTKEETVSPDWVVTDTFFAVDDNERIVGIILLPDRMILSAVNPLIVDDNKKI